MNTCYVNGKKYQFPDNASVCIENGNVKVNGKLFVDGKEFEEKVINITIEGNVEKLESGSADTTINGNCGGIKCGSGDIVIKGDVSGDVSTGSGDVECCNISGSVRTGSGDVNCKAIGNASGKKEAAPMSALKGVFDIFK